MLHRRLSAAAVLFLMAVVFPVAGQDKDKAKPPDKAPAPEKAPAPAPAPAGDKDKVSLQWKFDKDKTFYQTMRTETKQSMKVMNNDVNQTQKQTFFFSWKPIKNEGDHWIIEQTIEGVAMDIDIGGSKISYDSTKESTANNPLGEFFKALVGSKFAVTLDTKKMQVTKVEGRDEFLKKLVAANPQMKPLLEKILSDQALIEMAEPTFAVVPDKAVGKGDTWTKTSTLDMGPIGKYENSYKYTYEGKDEKEKNEPKIKVDTTLKYTPPGDVAGVGGLPFKIKAADLKSTNATGTIHFNSDKGRLDKSNMKLDLQGELSIEIGGQTTKVALSQTQETTVETSDDNPAKKKA